MLELCQNHNDWCQDLTDVIDNDNLPEGESEEEEEAESLHHENCLFCSKSTLYCFLIDLPSSYRGTVDSSLVKSSRVSYLDHKYSFIALQRLSFNSPLSIRGAIKFFWQMLRFCPNWLDPPA